VRSLFDTVNLDPENPVSSGWKPETEVPESSDSEVEEILSKSPDPIKSKEGSSCFRFSLFSLKVFVKKKEKKNIFVAFFLPGN
jgi:hypothetical protein